MRRVVPNDFHFKDMVCTACGFRTTVAIRRPGCPGGVLAGIFPPRCPECGGVLRDRTAGEQWADVKKVVKRVKDAWDDLWSRRR